MAAPINYYAFTLSMPSRASANGGWSGADKKFVVVRTTNSNKGKALYGSRVGQHWYNFGDGWSACVSVDVVDGKRARELKRTSDGFSGYDWMIDSIISYGKILSESDLRNQFQRDAVKRERYEIVGPVVECVQLTQTIVDRFNSKSGILPEHVLFVDGGFVVHPKGSTAPPIPCNVTDWICTTPRAMFTVIPDELHKITYRKAVTQ